MSGRTRNAGGLSGVPMARLALEPLESRLLLSGDVTAVVSGVDLVITGDLLDNDISITQGVTADEFVITGNLTTVNGGAVATVNGVTGSILIDMGEGADAVEFTEAAAPGNLSVSGGAGTNVLHVGQALNTTSIGGDLIVQGGDGSDSVFVSFTNIAGKASVKNGDGGGSTGFVDSTVAKDLVIINGEGSESVNVQDTVVGGSVKIDNGLGSGDHYTTIQGTAVDDRVTIGKDLIVKSKDGYDIVIVENADVGGSVKIDVSLDGGTVQIGPSGGDVNVTKDVVIKSKTSSLNLSIADLDAGGSLKVDNGSGSAAVDVTATTTGKDLVLKSKSGSVTGTLTDLTTAGSLKATFGANSTLAIDPTQIGKNLQVKATGGSIGLHAVDLEVLGKTTIQGGFGNNGVWIDDSTFWGDVAIKLNVAGDTVDIETNGVVAAITEFKGALKVDMGDGNDTITVGQPADANNQVIAFGPATFNGGAGLNDTLDVEGHGNVFASGKIVVNIENLPV